MENCSSGDAARFAGGSDGALGAFHEGGAPVPDGGAAWIGPGEGAVGVAVRSAVARRTTPDGSRAARTLGPRSGLRTTEVRFTGGRAAVFAGDAAVPVEAADGRRLIVETAFFAREETKEAR